MKTKTEKKEKTEGAIKVLNYLKSLFVSLIITFASIIIFAFIIKWASLPDSVIMPVNLVIKALSVFVGAIVLTKGANKGLLNGVIFALVFTLISFTIFSMLAGEFSLGLGLVADFGFNAVVGAIGGIIGVNRK